MPAAVVISSPVSSRPAALITLARALRRGDEFKTIREKSMKGKIALAGGGSEKDSRLIDEVFASWIEPSRKILYLPLALRGARPYDECLKWIEATFRPLHLTNIEMWTDLSGHQGDELFEFASVYIGGGNTYSLLAQFLESGFNQYLVEYLSQGE
jgi:dipeptidase E